MRIEMCIELILELAGFALLLALCDVVLFPSPAPNKHFSTSTEVHQIHEYQAFQPFS